MNIDVTTYTIHHLVKGEDLNHHGTLFAGRSAEWFVESGFIAAASLLSPDRIVCVKIHGMTFTCPIPPGSIVRYEGAIVLAGRTSLVAHVSVHVQTGCISEGFITFVHVDKHGKTSPHGITVAPTTSEGIALQEKAMRVQEMSRTQS